MSLPALAFTSLSLVAQIAPPKAANKASLSGGYDVRLSAALRTQLLEQIGQTPSALAGDARTRQKEMTDGLAALRKSLPDVEASISPFTGGLELLRNPRGALTSGSGAANARTVVMDFVQSNAALYGLSTDDVGSLQVRGESVSGANGLRMLRVEQRVHGLPVFQSETRFLVDRQGRLVRSVGRLAPRAASAAAPTPAITASQALVSALQSVGITIDAAAVTTTPRGAAVSDYADLRVGGVSDVAGDVVSQLVYFPLAPGVLRLAYQQTTFTSGTADWLTLVDASTGALLWRKNIRAYASTEQARFSVYVQADGKTPADSPAPHSPTTATVGSGFQAPEILRSVVNMLTAQDAVASPDGWIPDGGSTTTGNNVDACLDRVSGAGETNVCDAGTLDNNGRPVGNPDANTLNRDFLGSVPRDFSYAPAPVGGNPDAGDTPTGSDPAQDAFRRGAVTQLFYISNWYHDQVFHLGFDEAAGNFQQTNFSGMGVGGDRVLAEAQDAAGTNNANFATPPDGQSGRMQMFRFTGSAPDRDGSLDAEIVIHELTHGLSNRLVGNAAGLNFDVGAGLGEGWSDFYALSLLNSTNADDPNGSYASGGYATYKLAGLTDNYVYGIRRFPYSTDNTINPLTWADVDDVMANYSGGIPISPVGFEFGGALEVHNVGELWMLSLWEIRARVIADPAGANGDVPTGNRTMLQLVTDALKMTPIDPSVIDARDALLDADCATNACANERAIWEGFADRGLGYDTLAPLGKVGFNNLGSHMGVAQSFALPRLDIAARTIDDSLGNGSTGIDAGEPFQMTVSLKNPWRGAGLGVPSATATLTSSTPGVVIVDGTASFGAIAPQATVAASDTFTVAAPSAAACGGSIAFTLQVTSALGTTTQDFTHRLGVPAGTGAPITYTRTIPGGLAIPDNWPTGVADAMMITDDFEIADIDFRVDSLTHTFTGDVTAMLRGPNGYGVDLIWRRGISQASAGTGDNFVNTVIDDQSTNDLVHSLDAAAPFTASWAPAFNSNMWYGIGVSPDAVGQLSRFNGTSTKGVWTTLVSDMAAADTGTFHGWSIIVTPRAYSCSAYVDPAPTTAITTTPVAPNGANGWFTTPVTLSVLASDYVGGTVAETRCALDPVSAPASFGAIAPGCPFTAPGASVATDGLHVLYAASVDNNANAETPTTAAFKIDQTLPVLTCADTPPTFALNQAGAMVTATAADAVSGPASPTAAAPADTSSAGAKTVIVSVADNAGNIGSVSCAYTVASPTTVTIDTPTTDATFVSTGPFLALTGTAAVEGGTIETVTWTNDRGGSGMATGPAAGMTHWGAPSIPLQGGVNVITVTATDTEGHSSTDSVTVSYDALTYYLAEGSTGFFDLDIALANPNTVEAPITLTFIKPDGSTVVQPRTLPPTSRTTVRVDDIADLEVTPVSTIVTSTAQLPLGVERTMAWDGNAYGGSGGEAVNQPRVKWHFAEGAQGFFQSYFMVLNPSASEATATVTFQTEAGASIVRTYPLAAHSRLVIDASTVAELASSAFGTTVEATVPIVAERAMYFGSTPQRLFAGGHASVGAPDLFTTWYFAEGATGSFFDTYLLVGNPGDAEAHVTLRYLLDSGTVITRSKTIAPHARLTVEAESDAPELAQASFSTEVTSDVPVVAERAMYWVGAPGPWTEAHDSLGIPTPGTKWVLAEGRVGGPLGHQTFILLGNPSDTEAEVTITYLRADGTTTTGTYTVPPASRANVSVNAQVPALQDEAFGARIEVTNGVGIVVERSMYWNADGIVWAGGTSVVATRLP